MSYSTQEKKVYIDEQILDRMNRIKIIRKRKSLQEALSLENLFIKIPSGQVNIDKATKITFEQKQLYENQIQIWIPSTYQPLTEEERIKKYPKDLTPEYVFNDPKILESIAVRQTSSLLENNQASVTSYMQNMITNFKRMLNGRLDKQDEAVIEVHSHWIAYFDYEKVTLNKEMYYFVWVMPLEGRALIGTFSCRRRDMDQMRMIVAGILHTMKVTDTEPDRNESEEMPNE